MKKPLPSDRQYRTKLRHYNAWRNSLSEAAARRKRRKVLGVRATDIPMPQPSPETLDRIFTKSDNDDISKFFKRNLELEREFAQEVKDLVSMGSKSTYTSIDKLRKALEGPSIVRFTDKNKKVTIVPDSQDYLFELDKWTVSVVTHKNGSLEVDNIYLPSINELRIFIDILNEVVKFLDETSNEK